MLGRSYPLAGRNEDSHAASVGRHGEQPVHEGVGAVNQAGPASPNSPRF